MDLKTVMHVAHLARLDLSDAEAAQMVRDLGSITEYVERLGRVDVQGVDPTVHPVQARNHWREDQAQPGLSREQAVQNAPASEQNFFRVPPVIE